MDSRPGQPKQPAKTPEPTTYTEEALLSEQWPIQQRPPVDSAAFFRLPKQGEFRILTGFARDPIVVYGGGAPCRHGSAPMGSASKPAAADLNDGYVSKARAEMILRHGRGYLSRKEKKDGPPMWKELGLKPRRSGNKLLFRKADLYAHLERPVARKRGRPRSVTANVAA